MLLIKKRKEKHKSKKQKTSLIYVSVILKQGQGFRFLQQNKAPISQGGQAPRGPLNLSRRKLQCQETPQDRNLAPTEKVRGPEFNQENTSFQRTDSAGVHQCQGMVPAVCLSFVCFYHRIFLLRLPYPQFLISYCGNLVRAK